MTSPSASPAPGLYNEQIMTALQAPSYQPRRSKELARELHVDKQDYSVFRACLKVLELAGMVERRPGKRWGLAGRDTGIVGVMQVTRAGNGFLLPDDSQLDDVYVHENKLGSALNGDRVRVRLKKKSGRDFRQVGEVIEILERRTNRIVAILKKDGRAQPEDPKNPFHYKLEDSDLKPRIGEKILLEITVWGGEGKEPCGHLLEILGPAGAPDTETAAILASFDAPGPFPEAIKEAVRALPDTLSTEDRAKRLDLTQAATFTIDPESARDFDDALHCEVRENGDFVVGVHIADVAHYVPAGSLIDEEARERSTSIYLPTRVLPMLPEELSNNLCSLRPHEERSVKTILLTYGADGVRKDYHLHRSVICSRYRFTYESARDLLNEKDKAAAFRDQGVRQGLERLNTLAQILRQRRLENDSIELHLPEFRILFDEDGLATGVENVEHDFTHQLVEEFMLAANVALAEWCAANSLPVLHRVHESPSEEDLEDLAAFLTASGYIFKPPFSRRRLNEVIKKSQGTPEEHSINLAILKSFRQAVYAPEADKGHFALNFPRYMHFTSPIRRYADLHLHQTLDAVFAEGANKLPKILHGKKPQGGKALIDLGTHTSQRERRAMKIEEAVKDFRRLELLSRRDEREFTAVITGIRKFGIFVEIKKFLVEGMIPRNQLEQKGFSTREVAPGKQKSPRSGRNHNRRDNPGFHLGQEIKVIITKIDLSARLCEMTFVGLAK